MLNFKDETGGKPIKEFIVLKPKIYSVLPNGKQNPNLSHPFIPIPTFLQKKSTTTTTNLPPSPLNLADFGNVLPSDPNVEVSENKFLPFSSFLIII